MNRTFKFRVEAEPVTDEEANAFAAKLVEFLKGSGLGIVTIRVKNGDNVIEVRWNEEEK